MSKARNIANNGGRGTTANRPASPLLGDTYFDTTIGGLIVYTANGWGVPLTYTAPSAPTGLSVDPVTAIATFTAPSNTGNSPITSYTVTSSPGGITASGASSGITVAGLTSGTTYTFTVTATNAYGTSVASSPSSAVTYNPYALVGSMDALGSVTVGSGGQSSITFSAIPQTYTHLQLRYLVRNSGSGTINDFNILLNSDSSSSAYYQHRMYGDGGSAVAQANSGVSGIGFLAGGGATSGVFAAGVVDILDYTNTGKNKTIRSLSGSDNNGNGYVAMYSVLRQDTTPLTSIVLKDNGGTNIAQYSNISLYGIR